VDALLPLVVASAIGLAVMTFFVGFYRLAKPAGELEDRLSQAAPRQEAAPRGARSNPFARLSSRMDLEKRAGKSFALELAQADLQLTVNEFVMLRVGAAVAGLVVGGLLLRSLLFGLPLAAIGFQLPVLFLHRRRQQRQVRFQAQLVDVLTMLVSGLRAGVGLVQAMDLVRREMPAPAGAEFGRVVREVGLGASLEEAMLHLLERMPGDDLSMIATVINIQAEVGGNLASVLDGAAMTIRERVRILQEIRTLTSQQRLTGYILAGMPFVVGAAVMLINPGFMGPMFTPQWIWLPGIAVVMVGMGFVVINKIVDIKV